MSANDWLNAIGRESVFKLLENRQVKRRLRSGAPLFQPESLEPRRLLAAGPSVVSINRANPAGPITGSATVSYTVTFSEAVLGVTASDFTIVTTGSVKTSPTPVVTADSGSVYTVNIYGVTGNGALGLNLVAGTSIHDAQNLPLASNNAQGSFQPLATFAADPNPRSVAVADVNGDGIPDIITANGTGTVSVLLGNGNGTFQQQLTFQSGAAPYSVAVGDLNGDGKPDLVVANTAGGNVSVLLGNGNGTFQTATTLATGAAPQSVALADVNGDGKLDVIATNYADNSVSVLLGNGNGTFHPQATFATGAAPFIVQVADVNGDHKPDLVIADAYGRAVTVLLGNGDGTFGAKRTFYADRLVRSVDVVDLNGDGKPDLVVANNYNNEASILMGNGSGFFQAPRTVDVGAGSQFATTADINGDGIPDLIVANAGDNTISVLNGNGDGTFQNQRTLAAGAFPASLAVADLNADGQLDIVMADESGNNVGVLLANGQSGFTGQTYTVAAPAPLAVTLGGTIPASVVAGQKIKANPSITFTAVGGPFKGTVTESLYLSTVGAAFDPTAIPLGQSLVKNLNDRTGAHTTVHVKLASLPAGLANGTYELLVNVTEPGGVTAFAVAGQTITVAPPQIVLAGSVLRVPANAKAGKPLPVTISITNNGNIPATGSLPMLIYVSPDGLLGDAQQIGSQTHKISVKPSKTIHVSLSKLLAPATAGRYFILVRLDPGATFPSVIDPDTLLVSATAVTVS